MRLIFVLCFWMSAHASVDPRITAVETYLNKLENYRAKLVQTTLSGPQRGVLEGRFFLSKKTGLRIEYDSPHDVLVVGSKKLIHYYDAKADQISHQDIDQTPAWALLQPQVHFLAEFDLKNIQETEKGLFITAVAKKAPTMGQYTFKFNKKPMELTGWQVLDAQGTRIDVEFSEAKITPFSEKEKEKLFIFRNPRIYGKRTFERFPKWY